MRNIDELIALYEAGYGTLSEEETELVTFTDHFLSIEEIEAMTDEERARLVV